MRELRQIVEATLGQVPERVEAASLQENNQ
jgi:hypothetical protein